MTPEAFARALRAFTRRRPFQPFVIELHSGRRLWVRHPEAVIIRRVLIHFIPLGDPERHALFNSSCVSVIRDPEEGEAERSAPSQ